MPTASLFRASWLLALAGCATLYGAIAEASTVQPMNVEALADHSGQVIVGTVAEARSYWADNPRRIETEVTFDGVEYLKGQSLDSATTFSLVVPGGEVDDTRMTVCCAPEFGVGEKWVLFLLPSYKTFPVAGLYQGAFLVLHDAEGVERVVRRRHGLEEPVTGLSEDGFFVQSRTAAHSATLDRVIETTNLRVLPAAETTEVQEALRYDEFVEMIRPVLEASRDHQLTEPAGRRVLVEYQSVPLQRSQHQQTLDRAGGANRGQPPPRGLDTAQEVHDTGRAVPSDQAEVSR